MDASQESNEPLERLLRAALEESGAERQRRVDELCARHPEHADELRARLRSVDAFLDLAPIVPERLGEFVLGERLGGGGMGVVYRATQTSLGRAVALKLIRPEHLYFEHARARFRRETEAIAKLSHPGIVTIHVVGEERGVPYFAMELLEGRTLAQVVDDLAGRAPEGARARDLFGSEAPAEVHDSWVRACLHVVARVAAALAHAHARGLLHRDVKPSNVMLVPGDPPRVVLLDFGLTGALEPDSLGDELRTGSGVQLGTLAYMSPEQVDGRRDLDARTDVYSLGATLYELLTLGRPFRGETRSAVEARILAGAPASIRARNPQVSADVETVCRKALSVRPADRYADAAAFARDLENCLAGRPIEARPPGAVERALRTMRRYPARTAAVAATLALVVGLPSGLLWQERRYSADLERALAREEAAKAAALEAQDEATAARDRAREQFRESEDVLAYFLDLFEIASRETDSTHVSVRELLDIGAAGLERRLGDRPAVQAWIQVAIASAYAVMGFAGEGLPLAEAALTALRTDPSRPELVGRALSTVGQAHFERGDTRAAEARLREAFGLLAPLSSEQAELVAEVAMGLAQVTLDVGELEQARALMRRAEEVARADPDLDPAMLAEVLSNRALVELYSGDVEGSKALLDQALAIFERESDRQLVVRASTYNHLGLWHNAVGDASQAERWYARAADVATTTLGPESPTTLTYRANQAYQLDALGRTDEALGMLLEIEPLLRAKKLDGDPDVLTLNARIVQMLARFGRVDEVIARLEAALPHVERTFGAEHYELPRTRRDLANAYRSAGRPADAAPLERLAAVEFARYPGQEYEAPAMWVRAARHWAGVGDLDRLDALLFELFELQGEIPALVFDPHSAAELAALADQVGLGAEAEGLRASARPR